jgi:hypothetical protein
LEHRKRMVETRNEWIRYGANGARRGTAMRFDVRIAS